MTMSVCTTFHFNPLNGTLDDSGDHSHLMSYIATMAKKCSQFLRKKPFKTTENILNRSLNVTQKRIEHQMEQRYNIRAC